MNNTRRRVQKKRHRRRIQSHKRSILAIIGVLVLLTAVLTVNGMTLRAKEKLGLVYEDEIIFKAE